MLGIYEADKASAPKKHKIVKKKPRQAIDVAKIYKSLGLNEEEASNLCRNVLTLHERASLYQYYVERLSNDGTLAWRVKSASVTVLLMNDYESETGNLKVLSGGKIARKYFLLTFVCEDIVCALVSYSNICVFDHNKSRTIWHY